MNPLTVIQRFKNQSILWLLFYGVARGVVRVVPMVCLSIFLLAGLDRWVEMAIWGRQVVWFLMALSALLLFLSGFYPFSIFSLKERSQKLAEREPALRSDDLCLAVELAASVPSEGTSQQLQETFLMATANKLNSSRPYWCFPRWEWKKSVLLMFVVVTITGTLRAFFPSFVPVDSRTFFPFWSSRIEQLLKIFPGDSQVPMGQPVTIRIHVLETSAMAPVLSLKTGDSWLNVQTESESNGEYVYVVNNVVSLVHYRVVWKGESSRKYALTPVEPLVFRSFHVQLKPPEYTGKGVTDQESPEITGLAGTDVRLEAEATAFLKRAKLIFTDGRERDAVKIDGKKASFQFSVDKTGGYSFVLTSMDDLESKGIDIYPINVREDAPPTITLLAPDQDVVIGEKEKLPVTFDARDDNGLGEVNLQWETQSDRKGQLRIKRFDGVVENTLTTFDWELSNDRFNPGEVIRFRLEVVDKNTVTGPGRAYSDWRIVEIRGFELEHAVIGKALEAWRNKALETLAQITTLKSKTDAEKADMNQLSSEFNKPAQNMKALEESLKQIVNKMEQDPLADYGVWLEHKAMQENLNMTNQTSVKSAQAAFQTQNKSAASSQLEQIASELERSLALSEDLTKSQNARDVLQAGEKLEDIGEDLMKNLEEGSKDPAMMAKINDLLAEAQKNIMEMAQSLQQMPEELPDDFINQEALKNLELGKSQDILSQIADAVKKGDMKKALELAQKFLAAAKSMRKQVSKAHESFLKSNSAEDLAKKMAEKEEALQKITDEQRQILAETQKLASKRLEELMKAQEEMLLALAKRQEVVIDKATTIKLLVSQLKPMGDVLTEFRSKRVDHAPELLGNIISQSNLVEKELLRSSASASAIEPVKYIATEEAAILDMLKNPPEPPSNLSKEDNSQYSNLEQRQQELKKKTQGVKQELQMLSRKTASLGGELMQSLGQAGSHMESASKCLNGKNGPSAQLSEEQALDSLMQGQSALSQAQAAMSDMAMQQGGEGEGGSGSGSRGTKVILRQGGSGMGRGNNIGKVKLPNAEDYRPPKAFREDLLESLKENYPKIYEDIIHKYYKRLAE